MPHPTGMVCDPYIKLYLLPDPDKSTKQKTKVHRKTLSPNFDEGFRYRVSRRNLAKKTLSITVWDSSVLGGNSQVAQIEISNLCDFPRVANGELCPDVEAKWMDMFLCRTQHIVEDSHQTVGSVMDGPLSKKARQNRWVCPLDQCVFLQCFC